MIPSDLVANPRTWRMSARIAPECIDIVLHNKVEDNSLIYRHVAMDTSLGTLVKGIEEAVYASPLLLADFDRTDIVVESSRFQLIPSAAVTSETVEALGERLYPRDIARLEAIVNPLQPLDCTLVTWVDTELVNFLRRTFNNPAIFHHLAPVCRYFAGKSRMGNSGKMYANFREGHIDLIAFGSKGLLCANSFRVRERTDELYYIMALRKELGFDGSADELFLCGDPARREDVMPLLREYIPYVMPVIFPSTAMRSGEDAMKAPFNLIVLPLCE